MAKAKIAVNGYGTIGKRVADAIRAQDDMEVIGISKTKSNYEAAVAHQLGYQYFTNWIEKSFSFIPISKYFSVKCLKL